MRSGNVAYDGDLQWSGIDGWYWAAQAYYDTKFLDAYAFGAYDSETALTYYGSRHWGFLLRCLVR